MSAKQHFRHLLPVAIVALVSSVRRRIRNRRYSRMSIQETFSHIYRTNAWGGEAGQDYSGRGSAHPEIVSVYLRTVSEFLRSVPFDERTVVDLGCGDFRIGEQLAQECRSYVGTDIVSELIEKLQARGYPSHVSFRVANIVEDQLPSGRICILRQVLQHLSNREISKVLSKLRDYDYILLTEHFPAPELFVAPNLDKAHGPHIRREYGSAVCIDHAPFNVPASGISLLSEVPGDGTGQDKSAGVIRTFMFRGSIVPAPQQ